MSTKMSQKVLLMHLIPYYSTIMSHCFLISLYSTRYSINFMPLLTTYSIPLFITHFIYALLMINISSLIPTLNTIINS